MHSSKKLSVSKEGPHQEIQRFITGPSTSLRSHAQQTCTLPGCYNIEATPQRSLCNSREGSNFCP